MRSPSLTNYLMRLVNVHETKVLGNNLEFFHRIRKNAITSKKPYFDPITGIEIKILPSLGSKSHTSEKIRFSVTYDERRRICFKGDVKKQIKKLINDSFNKPEMVHIEKKSLSNDDIEQKFFVVREKHFKEAIARLIDDAKNMSGIVFCRTKLETKTVADGQKLGVRGTPTFFVNGAPLKEFSRSHLRQAIVEALSK